MTGAPLNSLARRFFVKDRKLNYQFITTRYYDKSTGGHYKAGNSGRYKTGQAGAYKATHPLIWSARVTSIQPIFSIVWLYNAPALYDYKVTCFEGSNVTGSIERSRVFGVDMAVDDWLDVQDESTETDPRRSRAKNIMLKNAFQE